MSAATHMQWSVCTQPKGFLAHIFYTGRSTSRKPSQWALVARKVNATINTEVFVHRSARARCDTEVFGVTQKCLCTVWQKVWHRSVCARCDRRCDIEVFVHGVTETSVHVRSVRAWCNTEVYVHDLIWFNLIGLFIFRLGHPLSSLATFWGGQ